MNAQKKILPITQEVSFLKDYLDNRGITYSWLTRKVGRDVSWLPQIFRGVCPLTKENQERIEEILGIKLTPQSETV